MDVDIPMARTSNTSTTMSRATTPSSPSRIGHGYGGIPGILPFLSPVAEEPNTALRVEENVDGDAGNMAESVTEEVSPEVSGVSMLPGSGNKETSAPPSASAPLTTVPDYEDGEDGEDVEDGRSLARKKRRLSVPDEPCITRSRTAANPVITRR